MTETIKEVCGDCQRSVSLGQAIAKCTECNCAIHSKCVDLLKFTNLNNNKFYCNNCDHLNIKRYNPFKIDLENDELDGDNVILNFTQKLEACKSHNVEDINNSYSAPQINSILVNKYSGAESYQPQHADKEITIDPESSIFTLSLGQPCSIVFVDRVSKEEQSFECNEKSLYHMTRKSQEFFEHRIDRGSVADGTRCSLTFRSVNWRNRNSTCIIGDSNTGPLKFGNDKRKSFGELMSGKSFFSAKVGDIQPKDTVAYNNVVIHCGINDLKHHSVKSEHDVKCIFNNFKSKLLLVRKFNPTANLFISPILPTKNQDFNKRANIFNQLITSELPQSNLNVTCIHGFDRFLDHNGFLSRELSRQYDRFGYVDMLHLNDTGSRLLAGLVKSVIFNKLNGGAMRRKRDSRVNGRSFAAVLSAESGGSLPPDGTS